MRVIYLILNENDKHFRIHNIAGLLDLLEISETSEKPIPIQIPDIIKIMSADITAWEASSRYNDNKVVLRKDINKVLAACKEMLSELKKCGFK